MSENLKYISAMKRGQKALIFHKHLKELNQKNMDKQMLNDFRPPEEVTDMIKSIESAPPSNVKKRPNVIVNEIKLQAIIKKIPYALPSLHHQKCALCEYETCDQVKWKFHMQMHSNENMNNVNHQLKYTVCAKCGKKLKTKSARKSHAAAHTRREINLGEQLKMREKTFWKKQKLTMFTAINYTQFPFHCAKCEQPFTDESDKAAHEYLCQRRNYKHLFTSDRNDDVSNDSFNDHGTIVATPWRPWC